jgi:hypothetical protein
MFAEPLGVAGAALAFNTRGRRDDADAGGGGAYGNAGEDYPVHAPGLRGIRPGVRCPRATLAEIPQAGAGLCSAIWLRRSKVRSGIGESSLFRVLRA